MHVSLMTSPTDRLKHLELNNPPTDDHGCLEWDPACCVCAIAWLLPLARAASDLSDKADIVLCRANGLDNKAGAIMGSSLVDLDDAMQGFKKAMEEKA